MLAAIFELQGKKIMTNFIGVKSIGEKKMLAKNAKRGLWPKK